MLLPVGHDCPTGGRKEEDATSHWCPTDSVFTFLKVLYSTINIDRGDEGLVHKLIR